jgi:hypothetical protein
MKIVKEHFKSISQMMDTLDKRPNNKIMRYQNSSSQKGNADWYGTSSYEEASQLMRTGYTEILPQVKEGLSKSAKVISKQFSATDMRRPRNLPIGFIPNVPNAILNLPDSMIDISITPQKRKTISIVYIMSGSCGTSKEMWIKAGIALLTAMKIVERMGISVSIDVSFYCGTEAGETAMGSVCVKHFGQPLDIQKLCFPIAHPSMFRRIGFKFLETTPIITKEGFAWGYGRGFECNENEVKKEIENDKTFILSGQWIKKHDYKVEEILKYLNFNKNGEQSERKNG